MTSPTVDIPSPEPAQGISIASPKTKTASTTPIIDESAGERLYAYAVQRQQLLKERIAQREEAIAQEERSQMKPPTISKRAQQLNHRTPEEIYAENIRWQKQKNNKLEKKRHVQEQELAEHMRPSATSPLSKGSAKILAKMAKEGKEYCSPTELFMDSSLPEGCGPPMGLPGTEHETFHPCINRRSQTLHLPQPNVVERLSDPNNFPKPMEPEVYCPIVKRDEEEREKYFQQLVKRETDAERKKQKKIEKERNEQLKAATFHPKTDPHSLKLAMNRTKGYEQHHSSPKECSETSSTTPSRKSDEFSHKAFLERNAKMMEARQRTLKKQAEELKKREEEEMKECTFSPHVNSESKRIIGSKKYLYIEEGGEESMQLSPSAGGGHSRGSQLPHDKWSRSISNMTVPTVTSTSSSPPQQHTSPLPSHHVDPSTYPRVQTAAATHHKTARELFEERLQFYTGVLQSEGGGASPDHGGNTENVSGVTAALPLPPPPPNGDELEDLDKRISAINRTIRSWKE